jgi:site-specific recombinase XerD
MLDRYFVMPETTDRILSSWISEPVERYVAWMTERRFAPRTVCRRVPLLIRFGEFARQEGASTLEELPEYVDSFVSRWIGERAEQRSECRRKMFAKETRGPIEQMLRVVLSDFEGRRRRRQPENPFHHQAPGFFAYLRDERGLRDTSTRLYSHHLRQLARYLGKIELEELRHLSPPVLSGFVMDLQPHVGLNSMRSACGVLRVFLRYAHRQGIVAKDLSGSVEVPRTYRLAKIPRSITWNEVRLMLETVDRRKPLGKRDYAILLLLVTYGLRAREVAALTLDDIDWRNERLKVPERKADHSTAYPLSSVVADAILDYLKNGRPETADRRVFFRTIAPYSPLTFSAISGCASRYLRKAGIPVSRPGSHTLRHTCVQRLVDAQFSLKMIGDYVGHRSAASTEIYTKVDIETLREVALGDGEEVLA